MDDGLRALLRYYVSAGSLDSLLEGLGDAEAAVVRSWIAEHPKSETPSVRLNYEGPARVVFWEGGYPDIEIGTSEEILREARLESLSERLLELTGRDQEQETSFTRVRISIEVLDASPVTKLPDPLEVSEGPQLPWPADPPDEPLR